MELTTEEIAPDVTCVRLVGSFDIAGADKIELMMNVLAGSRRKLLFDLGGVSFLASMGIRSLLTAARVVSRRGGKIVLINPNPVVAKVLFTTGTEYLLPVRGTLDEALALLAE